MRVRSDSTSLNAQETADGWLYPDIRRIREVSVTVTRGVIRAAQEKGVDREINLRALTDDELDDYIRDRMYNPFNERANVEDEVAQLVATASGGAHATNGNANGVRAAAHL